MDKSFPMDSEHQHRVSGKVVVGGICSVFKKQAFWTERRGRSPGGIFA